MTDANEELSRINWISTHDLKEPLRKIQMFGSRILESEKDQLSEMVANSVARMRLAANRMQILIDDILLYSRMNITDAAADTIDLNSVIQPVLDELEEEIKAGDVRVNIGEMPVIKGIAVQLAQLFRNLLSNAMKFAKKDESMVIDVSCSVMNKEALTALTDSTSNQFYHVQVRDNGIGFEPMYANRIFDVFQRLHTTAEYPGTGIGLAICRKIMLNHEGVITAEGEIDKGAIFHLYFPFVE